MTRTRAVELVIASVCLWMMGIAGGSAQEAKPAATAEARPLAVPETPATPAGRLTLGGAFGEDREVYQIDAMIPVLQSKTAGLFLNARGVEITDEEQAAGVGLVVRSLLERPSVILGINGDYAAANTEADNSFEQVAGGVEVLSRWVDVRANYYHPLTDTPQKEGTTIEVALQGWDAEVGVWLPYLSRYAPTAVYAGYYMFDSDDAKEDVDGFKARLESRLHPNVTFDAEWYDDKSYAGTEYYVGVRLHIPLDFWKGARMYRGGDRVPPLSARMLDPVHRDLRVRVEGTEYTRSPEQPIGLVSKPRKCQTYATLDENGDVIYIQICD